MRRMTAPLSQPRDFLEFDREWIELLNEVRVILPGVQLLFAFLFAAPFSDRFTRIGPAVLGVFFASFVATTGACAFLIAPSVYHRLHWRRDVADKERMILTCNRMAITGVVLLALAMTSAMFVLSSLLFVRTLTFIATGTTLFGFGCLWFVLPLSRRHRARPRPGA
jgi:predicted membrane channel-forming protein YqfA (hemolysin III family)